MLITVAQELLMNYSFAFMKKYVYDLLNLEYKSAKFVTQVVRFRLKLHHKTVKFQNFPFR
jgi:hypothetical protein